MPVEQHLTIKRAARRRLLKKLASQCLLSASPPLLDSVRAKNGMGVYASAGPKFKKAIFGRDSIEVAEDLLPLDKRIPREVILTMARFQGQTHNEASDEEPGRIFHEYRTKLPPALTASADFNARIGELSDNWDRHNEHEYIQYRTVDATPLFVRLVDRYCRRYGKKILSRKLIGHDGKERTLRQHVRLAIAWIEARLERSAWGLLEFYDTVQAWKDSDLAYIHIDGEPINLIGGVAAVEVQGYAYDALQAAGDLVGRNANEAARWHLKAKAVQRKTIELMWMKDVSYFAQGVDRDENGKARQIKTLASNGAALLDSHLLLDITPEERTLYENGIANMIMSEEFLTPYGIRCRALKHASLTKFADYQGSYTVWPKETFDITKGLYRHGLPDMALRLSNRTIEAIITSGEFPEFYFVDKEGNIRPKKEDPALAQRVAIKVSKEDEPEPDQAWTISAFMGSVELECHSPNS